MELNRLKISQSKKEFEISEYENGWVSSNPHINKSCHQRHQDQYRRFYFSVVKKKKGNDHDKNVDHVKFKIGVKNYSR